MIINALKRTLLVMFFMSGFLAIAPFALAFGIPGMALVSDYGLKAFLLIPYGVFVLIFASQYFNEAGEQDGEYQ